MIFKMQRNLLWNPRNGCIPKSGSSYSGKVLPQKSRKKFPVRTISNPEELIRLGYLKPSIPMIPVNDYEVLKKVA